MTLDNLLKFPNEKVFIVLESLDLEDLEITDWLATKEEIQYLLSNEDADISTQEPQVQRLVTIYRETSSNSTKGRVRWILNRLAV